MRALVVYESLYGNTAAIGLTIARSLRTRGFDARALPVSAIDPAEAAGVDLLVVGGPTHAHGMSSATTRSAAAKDEANTYADPTISPGLRRWVKEVAAAQGRLAAAFDTRFDKPVLVVGSAARAIARRLGARGFLMVLPPESFFVSTDHRLHGGQQERAVRWAAELVNATREASRAA